MGPQKNFVKMGGTWGKKFLGLFFGAESFLGGGGPKKKRKVAWFGGLFFFFPEIKKKTQKSFCPNLGPSRKVPPPPPGFFGGFFFFFFSKDFLRGLNFEKLKREKPFNQKKMGEIPQN